MKHSRQNPNSTSIFQKGLQVDKFERQRIVMSNVDWVRSSTSTRRHIKVGRSL